MLSGHALGDVVLKSQGKPLSFTVRQLLVDITADNLILKSGGRLVTSLNILCLFLLHACYRISYVTSI